MPIAIYALALAAFAIGTTEFVISGILPAVSSDLAVSIPTAGLLVTGYAAGVAVGGPILALLTARFPHKLMIVILMLVFALGQVLCALAPSYGLLLVARLVSACGHGVFFGIASVAVSRLVPAERRGAALSLFVGGITIANILGLPGGTAIGNAFGWRASFAAIAAFALLATIAIALTLPSSGRETEPEAPLRQQAVEVGRQQVWTTYLIIAVLMVGGLSFATFQVPVLTEITAIDPAWVPLYLLLSGLGAVIGIWTGGRLADWKLVPSLIGILIGLVLCNIALLFAVHHPIAMAVAMLVTGAFGFAFSTPCQVRILNTARAAPNLAATLVSTAYNVGIAAGAFLGAMLLSNGLGYEMLPAVGIVTASIALVILLLSSRAESAAHTVVPA